MGVAANVLTAERAVSVPAIAGPAISSSTHGTCLFWNHRVIILLCPSSWCFKQEAGRCIGHSVREDMATGSAFGKHCHRPRQELSSQSLMEGPEDSFYSLRR